MAISWVSAVLDGDTAQRPHFRELQCGICDLGVQAQKRSKLASLFHERKHLLKMSVLSMIIPRFPAHRHRGFLKRGTPLRHTFLYDVPLPLY